MPLQAVLSFDLPRTALVITQNIDAMACVAAACRRGGFMLHHVLTPQEATRFLKSTLPSIVFFDIPVLESKTLAWLQSTRADPRTARTAMLLTSRAVNPEEAVEALNAGADDYFPHGGSMNELLARIRAILRCRTPELAGDEVVFGPLIVRPCEREVLASVQGVLLRAPIGPTEFRLLHFLVTYPETVHSREAIRCRLWPDEQSVSERTVDAHVRRLRRSLASVGLQALVETVLSIGYRIALPKAA